MSTVFEKLNAVNVNDHTEQKNKLTYLSWTWAWAEVKEAYPDANYEIWRDADGKPYIKDPDLGYMVSTKITIDGLTHEMWLPVMDYNNNAMKSTKYKLIKGRRSYDVEPATMFDVNTALMRCLVKNLAMFGLGLYIYAGEDLPESESTDAETASTSNSMASTYQRKSSTKPQQASMLTPEPSTVDPEAKEWQDKISEFAETHNMTTEEICKDYKVGLHTPAERLREVYEDLTSAPKEEPKKDMPDFAALDEKTPFD